MDYVKNRLGAWQIGDDFHKGQAEFKLFFPDGFDPKISSIRVAGSFQKQISNIDDWDFENGFEMVSCPPNNDGTIWQYTSSKELKAGFYEYKYLVTFNDSQIDPRKLSDPFARYGGKDNQNAGFVIGGSKPSQNKIHPLKNGRKPLRDLIMYELNIDDFTSGYRIGRAPLDAVRDKLDYIEKLGFNAILFMPWTAWEDRNFDWGYRPFQYFAVEYLYANDSKNPSEKISWLKHLISECHDRDIHVIMDGVFNHVSVNFPFKYFYQNPQDCPFTGTFGGTFDGLQDLNFNNKCTNEFIRDVCFYWIDNFKIDGIRFDNTTNFYVLGNMNGLPDLLENIENHMNTLGEKYFSLTLEHLKDDAVQIVNTTKSNSYWDNALFGCAFQYLWWNEIDSSFLNKINNQRFLNSTEKVPTSYLSNHDHSCLAWQAGAKDNMGSLKWYKTQPYVIALYTNPGVPLVPNGQEFGEDHWIPEDDQGTSRRVLSRPLRWKLQTDKIGEALIKLYTRMGEIRNKYMGLHSPNFSPQPWDEWQTTFNSEGYGIDTSKKLVIYRRWGNDENGNEQQFVIVLNFSDNDQFVHVPFPQNGEWTDLLSEFSGSWKINVGFNSYDFIVGSNWGHVFFKS